MSQDDVNLNERAYYTSYVGLCASLRNYLYDVKNITNVSESHVISNEMKSQFVAAGLDSNYPFDAHMKSYDTDAISNTMRKNPRRRAWVAARIADCEEK
ncbi:hypothetical protein [Citrobacter phage Tr1]|nr:hypothetical protein [Citrobacter phage Tr1]